MFTWRGDVWSPSNTDWSDIQHAKHSLVWHLLESDDQDQGDTFPNLWEYI